MGGAHLESLRQHHLQPPDEAQVVETTHQHRQSTSEEGHRNNQPYRNRTCTHDRGSQKLVCVCG